MSGKRIQNLWIDNKEPPQTNVVWIRPDNQGIYYYIDGSWIPVNGKEGDSAYEVWLDANHYNASEHPVQEFLDSLKGEPGETYTEKPAYYNNGLAVMFNGVDISHNPLVQATCTSKWYGSASAYANLVRNGQVREGVAYYLTPNPDWDETNEESLSFIMNKPNVLDAKINENHTMKLDFFYK